jgi:hypothetical protein
MTLIFFFQNGRSCSFYTLATPHLNILCYNTKGNNFHYFHVNNVHLVIIKVFNSQIDAQENCLKNNIKIYIKKHRHVSVQSHHHQGAHYSCLLKLLFLK